METETAREVGNRGRGRARGEVIGHARTSPMEHEDHENGQAPSAPAKKTRRHIPASEKTHFSFTIELPIGWMGPLKWRSIQEQRKGTFTTGSRENDAQALLRHVVRSFCEEVVEEDSE